MVHPLFPLLSLASLIACQSAAKPDGPDTYTPTGTLADLVYNPVRPDGSIDSSYLPILAFDTVVFDFGEIREGEKITHQFSFANTGTAPLLIQDAKTSCGCTVPAWPKQLVPPDSTGIVTVTFDSAGKSGSQSKQVTIFANTYPNQHLLTLRGIVKPANS